MKDNKCKCTHLKSEHKKGFITKSGECSNCHCNEYLISNAPEKWHKFSIIMIAVMSIVMVGVAVYGMYEISQKTDVEYMENVTIDEVKWLSYAFISIAILFAFYVFIDPVTDYIKYKNRRDYNE